MLLYNICADAHIKGFGLNITVRFLYYDRYISVDCIKYVFPEYLRPILCRLFHAIDCLKVSISVLRLTVYCILTNITMYICVFLFK